MRRVTEIAAELFIRTKRVVPNVVSVALTLLVLAGLSICSGYFHKREQYVARCVQRAYHRGECTAGIQDVCEARWLLRDGIEE